MKLKRENDLQKNCDTKSSKKEVFMLIRVMSRMFFYTNQPIFVLLYKKVCFNTNELDESLPTIVVSLLQEYDDVFPNDVPSGLSPIRGIEHQIDFVPGATIPN